MWVAELQIAREKSEIIRQTKNLRATIASYYLNVFKKGKRSFVNKVAVIEGPDKDKMFAFVLKTPKFRVHAIEGNQVFYEHESLDTFNARVLNSSVFLVRPIFGKGGLDYWTVGSWNKENVRKFVKKLNSMKGVEARLLSLKEEKVDMFLSSAFSNLSKKQANAVKKAVALGYYDFPRKISLEELAKKEGVNESTFREHLRKAEGRIMNAALKQAYFF